MDPRRLVRPLLCLLCLLALGLPASAGLAPAQDAAPPSALEETVASPTTTAGVPAPAEEAPVEAKTGFQASLDRFWGKWINKPIADVIFFDIWFIDDVVDAEGKKDKKLVIPFAVLWLVFGAIVFTLRMGFINVRAFKHAIDVTRGKFDDPSDEGEVTHFQALAAALSATVGLGNIASVTIAVMIGGPGAIFWMVTCGVLGMSSKFTECSLGQMYREVRPDGRVMGGAMFYLSKGLKEMGMGGIGKILAVFFAVLCIGGSFAGGNSFQVNQSLNAIEQQIPFFGEHRWVYGILMAIAVGIVIIGGIKRIAATAEKIVPFMCATYVVACLTILFIMRDFVPAAAGKIFTEAFAWNSVYGGLIGTLILGFKRAAFSNEAGIGSAAIAHSAARTPYAVREGIVSLLEPFIDTVIVCTMTGLVITVCGAYQHVDPEYIQSISGHLSGDYPDYAPLIAAEKGASVTSLAFGSVISWFPWVLAGAVVLFAYSTLISWSYYGERCWCWLFGDRSSMLYRWIFLVFVFLGSVLSATNVLEFGDLMILGMALPNILGALLLSGKVRRRLDKYWAKYQAGEFREFK
jgi:alanine or glycine:cation symporter, AGCS family